MAKPRNRKPKPRVIHGGLPELADLTMSDQAQADRDRHTPDLAPLGDNEPDESDAPQLNDDGSADIDLDDDEADESSDVTELEDGSAIVKLADNDSPIGDDDEFDANLAEKLDDAVLARLSSDLVDAVERDQTARSKRDEQYAEGIKRTGLGNEAPGGAVFEGASRAVHPVLVEGCIDFAARAMKELFPANGPVKSRIIGKQTKLKLQKADRKSQYMNWQATTQIKEYRRELEVLLTQLPLGGGQYLKVWFDQRWERIRTEFVPIDDLLLPFEATSLASAQRVTHVQRINRATFAERTESGLYREIAQLGEAVVQPQQTEAAEAAAKVEGVEDPSFNEDGLRMVYETQIIMTLEEDPLAKRELMPYILTVDEPTGKVLALRRNWDKEDNDKAEPLSWIVEYPFIPWRGAYPIGLGHIIGSLSGAATGALRALLDSAHINNIPGGVKLGGARVTGQTVPIEPTQITTIEGSVGVDDIRKLVMPLPFNPPSTVLFSLLQWITDQAKGVVGTADEKIADATNNMPVGTALALIEQGSITFSAIHSRLHNAQKETLAIIHRLNGKYLSDEETVEDLGELVVSRSDFQGPMDVEPVSDPNIFSDAQRYAQIQAVFQLSSQAPQLYKLPELHKRALQLLKFPAPDEVLATPGDPEELDPIAENMAATDPQKALKAYEDQDHMDHLRSHLSFMTSPILGMNPMMVVPTLPALLAHCKEHIVMLYGEHARAAVAAKETVTKAMARGPLTMPGSLPGVAAGGFPPQSPPQSPGGALGGLSAPAGPAPGLSGLPGGPGAPPGGPPGGPGAPPSGPDPTAVASPGGEADAIAIADQELAKLMAPLMPLLQAAQLAAQKAMQGGAPPDPRIAAAQMKQQTDQQRLGADQQNAQADHALEAERIKLDAQAEAREAAAQDRENEIDAARLQLEQTQAGAQAKLDQLSMSLEAHFKQLAQAAEAQRATADQQIERWQTQVEMTVASRNADLAAQQAEGDRQQEILIQQIKGAQAEALSELQSRQQQALTLLEGRISAMLERLKPDPKPKGE